MNGTSATDPVVAMFRGQLTDIVLGTVFLSIGATACAIAAIRWRSGVRILVWWGIWSGLYGAERLMTPAVLQVLPLAIKPAMPLVSTIIYFLVLVTALFAWRELSLGLLRWWTQGEILVAVAIAIGGVSTFLRTGSSGRWADYNNLLALIGLVVLLVVVIVPRFGKFLVVPNHRVLTAGTIIFALEALYTNFSNVLHYRNLPIADSLGFAVLLLSLGYVALEMLFTSESRLLSLQVELEAARQIQSSILPHRTPEIEDLLISAAYRPMTAVAGDFYEFFPVDQNRVGFLVADVSGHGVPAALIASMIKVAMQSVLPCAASPSGVLSGLNRILSGQLQGQFVSAAYLWLDTKSRKASYSAAGHPPLLFWRNEKLERIESNGLLFGVMPDSEFPVFEMPLDSGDRFLLYTDGIIEAENAAGDFFGDSRLEQVVRANQLRPASELSDRLLSEIRQWQPANVSQQDDITLIVIDVA